MIRRRVSVRETGAFVTRRDDGFFLLEDPVAQVRQQVVGGLGVVLLRFTMDEGIGRESSNQDFSEIDLREVAARLDQFTEFGVPVSGPAVEQVRMVVDVSVFVLGWEVFVKLP